MTSVLPQLFLRDQFVNSSCGGRMGCDALSELGPPPDLILNIPPPPVPPFMDQFVSKLASEGINIHSEGELDFPEEGKDCNLCRWSDENGVGFVELAQKGPLIDDTWFLVIISSCVGATLIGIILAIGFLKYREGKLKPLSDVVLAKKEKALGLERCEAVLYPTQPQAPSLDTGRASSRALWAGLKPLEGNHYTVDHCQPMDQKKQPQRLDLIPASDNTYDYADYSSITYTTIGAPGGDGAPPPLPAGRPVPSSSFENVGYVPGDDAVELEKLSLEEQQLQRRSGQDARAASYLLGGSKNSLGGGKGGPPHLYEMVTPPRVTTPAGSLSATSSRRHKSVDHGHGGLLLLRNHHHAHSHASPVIISAPTSVPAALRLPPLNSRYNNGRYTLTAFSNGSHTLTLKGDSHQQRNIPIRLDRKYAHVSLDRTGTTTKLAGTGPPTLTSPTDNIYASPITSPVI